MLVPRFREIRISQLKARVAVARQREQAKP